MDNNSSAAVSPDSLDSKLLGSYPGESVREWCALNSSLQKLKRKKRRVVSNNIIPITLY
jgi:hypothetical protein